jgi:hypothetical protein
MCFSPGFAGGYSDLALSGQIEKWFPISDVLQE